MQTYAPVIIIGAGRSGTNILRDVLTTLPKFGTWPCDEINYIWRHGNVRVPTDEFGPELARPAVQTYILRQFNRMAQRQQTPFLVEKTCANSLRVGFVDRIVPNAKYLFLVRDGRDVVASALKRWQAALDLPYLLRKARFVPPSDLPYYGIRYAGNRLHRLTSSEKRLASWGPRFEGMQEWLRQRTLPEVCAQQWVRSVERAEEALAQIDPMRVFRLTYEEFVDDPAHLLDEILHFLGLPQSDGSVEAAVRSVKPTSIGNWKKELSPEMLAKICPVLQPTLEAHGYR